MLKSTRTRHPSEERKVVGYCEDDASYAEAPVKSAVDVHERTLRAYAHGLKMKDEKAMLVVTSKR